LQTESAWTARTQQHAQIRSIDEPVGIQARPLHALVSRASRWVQTVLVVDQALSAPPADWGGRPCGAAYLDARPRSSGIGAGRLLRETLSCEAGRVREVPVPARRFGSLPGMRALRAVQLSVRTDTSVRTTICARAFALGRTDVRHNATVAGRV
jgi:hypothetical protein